MKRRITIPFQVTAWEAVGYGETENGPKLSRVTVRKSFDAEGFRGASAGELLMCAVDGGGAGYTILDVFTVEIDGRAGSFAAIHGGMTDEMKAAGRIVPGSGTGALAGISGALEFVQDENGKSIIFDYAFGE